MTLKVGLIVGREWSFPPAFIEEVNRRDEGVTAEYVTLGAPRMDQPAEYAVIIDRISHEVPFYRTFLKQAVLQGTTVVNNPFMWTADDKFFGAALATSLGIAHPKTVVLPNKEYIPGIVKEESLRNLQYPLDWQGIVDYVGLPCVLKDAHGGGWKDVYICRSLDELIYHYDSSGLLTMVVQEFIKWDHFIRCICLGQEEILPIRYDPGERKYHVDHAHMSDELGRRVVADSLKLVRALGYDMNSMEWAVKDGIPYAIDFMNPAPDMDVYSLTPHYFDWVVKHMADMAIHLARNPRKQAAEVGWASLFQGRREMEAAVAASPVIQAPRAESGSANAYATAGSGDDARGGYLIGGGWGGGARVEGGDASATSPAPESGGENPPVSDGSPAYDAGGPDDGGDDPYNAATEYPPYDAGSGDADEVQADEGAAEMMDARGGYLIGGGVDPESAKRGGAPRPAADVDGVDSSDFLVGDKSVAEMGEDPGDLPDDVVDEEASEGHA
ncbi:ATP-grasp domain-containing protein [Longimicrobium sp.]|uniref:ATP-grasp domain-containing protein n=1 Tax=Longimicrobium sp. TaxID=2029185 RepID=UPI003B3B41E9